MSSDIAINVENLGKCYQIYDRPQHRLLQMIVRNRKQYFREFWALKDISFDIRKGETVGIIGRNGSGKSTLLQLICGTLSPTSGSIKTNGRIAALLELGSGFNPEFTGRENVFLNATILGLSIVETNARYDAIVRFADIGDFIDQPVKTYSSGMVVRLAFAVIAHVDADILVIDEALAVGDAFFTQKCMRYLREFQQRGTILFVSHDTGAIINLCARAIWLDKGKIRMQGNSKELCESYLASSQIEKHGSRIQKWVTDEALNEKTREQFDPRLNLINESVFRNAIQIFSFNPSAAAYGAGGATIISVRLLNEAGTMVNAVLGGERVTLVVEAEANEDLDKGLIFGFFFKDRLGQYLFGDNTYLTYHEKPVNVRKGERVEGHFTFLMPILPIGDYSICAAIAEGTQEDHLQHHWVHDALIVKSHSSSVSTGLIGIPVEDIKIVRQ